MEEDVAAAGGGAGDAGEDCGGDGDVGAERGVACWVAVDGYLAGRVFGYVDAGGDVFGGEGLVGGCGEEEEGEEGEERLLGSHGKSCWMPCRWELPPSPFILLRVGGRTAERVEISFWFFAGWYMREGTK